MKSESVLPGVRVDRLKLALYASEVGALLAIQQKFNSLLDPSAVIKAIADEARRLTSAEASIVYLLREDQCEVVGVSGSQGRHILGHTIPLPDSLAGRAILYSKGFVINDIQHSTFRFSWIKEKMKATSFLVVPLIGRNGAIGAVLAASPRPEKFTKDDLLLLELVMPSAALALENAQRYVASITSTLRRERYRVSRKVQAAASQTLFSVLLIADILPRLVERDPQQGRERMEELREITRKAIHEVRDLAIDEHS